MQLTRADRSVVSEWWFTVDRLLICAVFCLMVVGLLLSLSASPAVALKKGLPAFYFFNRQLVWAAVGAVLLFGLSLMSPARVRRFSSGALLVMLAVLVYVHFAGTEINGAQRWLNVMGLSFQPSEFVKPVYVVVLAWLFAEAQRRPDMPALLLAVILGGGFAGLLVLQPDIGQALLVSFVWGALYVLSGQPLIGAVVLAVLALCGLIVAYLFLPHVTSRIDAYLLASPAENSQLDRAMRSFVEGGFFGRGPGEGTIKTRFPDAHTDFIFAVIAEEYGVIACLLLLGLFGFVVLRALVASLREPDMADRLALQGLALIFGVQSLINMGVNVGLLPAKGMTLPYISAGGSSHIGISITLGMVLALTRQRVRLARANTSAHDGVVDGFQDRGATVSDSGR